MAKLYFRVQADYDRVIKLREEIAKLKQELKGMDSTQSPSAFNSLNVKLGAATQEFNKLTHEAAQAGTAMEHNFKKGIFNASQAVNDFTQKIINQKAVVKDVEADVRQLGESYRSALKSNPLSASSKLSEYTSAKKVLDEEKAALFGLTQEQANARLSVKKLRDEYSLYKDDGKGVVNTTDGIGVSLKKAFVIIGGAAAIKQLGSEIIRVRGEFQSMQTAIETLVGKDMAGNLIPQIKELAKVSPLTLTDMVGAEKMMLGFNIKAEDTIRYLQALGDISMGNSQKFNSLTLAFSQTSAAGKLMGQDLNQMINAGFNPLQQISDTTGKSIATLKDEMSKGAISAEMVQKAFIDATSAGGKFFGMSENASRTINGQLSMMQDALDEVFNELGAKGESVIMSGIQATTSLIQNYETVGKILSGLVVTYGAYRTAVMLSTIATGKHTIAEVALTNVRVMARRVQMALNASMLANPYVLLATAVVGLGAAMWAMSDSTTAAEKAQRRFNEEKESAIKKEQDHKQKLEELISTIQNEYTSSLDRVKAMDLIKANYPSLFQKYIDEKGHIRDLIGLWKEYNEESSKGKVAENKKKYANSKSVIDNYQKVIGLWNKFGEDPNFHKNDLSTDEKALANKYKNETLSTLESKLNEERNILIDYQKEVRSDELAQWQLDLKKKTNVQIKSELDEMKRIQQARKGNPRYSLNVGVGSLKGATTDSELQQRISVLDSEYKIKQQESSSYKKDYEKAKIDWESAKKALSEIEKDKAKFTSKQYEEAKVLKEATEKKYKDLGGITGSSLTKQENQAEKLRQEQEKLTEEIKKSVQERKEAIIQSEIEIQQLEIDLMDEGAEKQLAQIRLNYDKRYQEIAKGERALLQKIQDEERKQWEKDNPDYEKKGLKFATTTTSLTPEQRKPFDKEYSLAYQKREKDTKAYYGSEEQAMNEYLAAYGTYMKKRQAILDQAEAKKKGKSDWEKKTIDQETNKSLSDLHIEVNKKTAAFSKLFSDMKDRSVKDMKEIAKQAEKALEFLKGGQWDEGKGLEFGISKETFDQLQKAPEEVENIEKGIKDLNNEIVDCDNSFRKMGGGFKKVFEEGGDPKKLREGLAEIESGMNDVMQVAGFLSNTLSSLGESFGNDTLKGTAEGIGVAMDAIGSAMDGAKAGAMFGPIGAAAGAAIGLVSSLASSIAKIHDTKSEKRIELLQDQIDVLDRSYDKLGKSIEKAYSSDASKLIGQQDEMLKQKKQLIENQILEEESKKNSDDGRIQEYRDRIEDINETIAENAEKAKDAIFGEDIKSAIDNFAQAYADAWATGNDRAKSSKELVKNMVKQMIMEMIKMDVAKPMEQIREKIYEAMYGKKRGLFGQRVGGDGKVDSKEQATIEQMVENAMNDLDDKYSWADDFLKDDDSREASQKGIATASQDSVDENNGRLTMIQGHTYNLNENVGHIANGINSIAGHTANLSCLTNIDNTMKSLITMRAEANTHLANIDNHTANLINMREDMHSMRQDINTMVIKGLKLSKY